MQQEFGISVNEFDQREEEALVTSSVQICDFLFELKAVGLLSNKCQALQGSAENMEHTGSVHHFKCAL